MATNWCTLYAIAVCFTSADVFRVSLKKCAVKQPNLRLDFRTTGNDASSFRKTDEQYISNSARNYKDEYYYGSISIGTPPQEFLIAYDWRSTDLWVPTSQCEPFNYPCWQRKKYELRNSLTHEKDGLEVSVEFNKDLFWGYTSRDTITVGSNTPSIKRQQFVEVVKLQGLGSLDTTIQGIFGMGIPKANSSIKTILQTMVEQGLIESTVHCILLNRIQYAYGKHDMRLKVDMLALVHPGTIGIILMSDIYSNLFGWLFSLDLKFDKTIEDTITGTTECEMRIMSTTDTLIVLGDAFMRRYYTMFDSENMRIGFAPAVG